MARVKTAASDDLTLQMALIGYELERQKIDDKISEIRALLGGKKAPLPSAGTSAAAPAAPRKRNLSAAARKRIALAQKRRWAEHRKNKALAAAKTRAPKGVKSEPKADTKG